MRKMKIKGERNDEQFILSIKQLKNAEKELDSLNPEEIDNLMFHIHNYADAAEHLEVASEYEEEAHDKLEELLKKYDIKKAKLEIKRKRIVEDFYSNHDNLDFGEYITTLKIKKDEEEFVGLDVFKLMIKDPELYQALKEKYPFYGSEYTIGLE